MYFDGDDLISNGDKGVRRLYCTKGDDKCDKVSDIWLPTKNDGEHAANGIVKGPDGWYYMITGNDAGMSRDLVNQPGSPVKDPNSGVVLRFNEGGTKREIIAHGFRNPYDLAFNHLGQLFTYDSDGERIHYMPYYAPTRVFDIAQGMHHGWIMPGWQFGWSRPQSWPDNVERMVEVGRGSPTGVVIYRHRNFPDRYRNGMFALCWTFGRLYFFPLEPDGSTYKSKKEVFMQTTGDVGFAPTDMAVGPKGELYIAIGGRGTRGSVFRVRYVGAPPVLPHVLPLKKVLAADEPLSSWSRAQWVPIAKKLGTDEFVKAALHPKLAVAERIRAVEVLTELFDGLPMDAATKLCEKNTPPDLTARVVWSLSRGADRPESRNLIAAMTASFYPRVGRAAWEAVLALPTPIDPQTTNLPLEAGFMSRDRRIRAAAIRAAQGPARASFAKVYSVPRMNYPAEELAMMWVAPPSADTIFHRCAGVIREKALDVWLRLESVRLLQIALGDVSTQIGSEKPFVGYIASNAEKVEAKVRQRAAIECAKGFPSVDGQLDMELARLLGMLQEDVSGLPEKLADKWTSKSQSEEDIHYLLVLSRLPGERSSEVTRKTAYALASIHVKLAQRGAKPNDQVPGILEALLARLVKFDPGLPAALVADAQFGVPGHAIFANNLPLAEKQAAARKLIAGIAKLEDEQARIAWSPDLIKLVSALPDAEALPILRKQFADPRLTDTVALQLAKKGQPEDRARWIDALISTQPTVVAAMAEALLTLDKQKPVPVEVGKAVRALRRLEGQKVDPKVKQTLVTLLEGWTGAKLAIENPKEDISAPWVRWYMKTYPKDAAALPGLASADFATWKKRLDKIDWDPGDEKRGEVVFQRKNCYRCHGESRRLGPDLTGIAQRFSRDDLFVAIFDPSKDIAPAFKATTIVTKAGKVHNGMIIYESPDLHLLQTTPDITVRIGREELELVQPSNISFMPTGLLDDLTDADLRDLYAYIKSLRKR